MTMSPEMQSALSPEEMALQNAEGQKTIDKAYEDFPPNPEIDPIEEAEKDFAAKPGTKPETDNLAEI